MNYLYVHNEFKDIIKTNHFYEESFQTSNPSLFMYQALESIARRQTLYPFQLLKQFILFSDEQDSISVNYTHMRCQLELIEENIKSPLVLARQRVMLEAFTQIKNIYRKRLRIEQVYYQEQNLLILFNKVSNFLSYQSHNIISDVFTRLYDNFRGFNSKINVSKIDQISYEAPSKQLQHEYKHFLGKIEAVNSEYTNNSALQDEVEDSKLLVTLKKATQRLHRHKGKSSTIDFKTPKYIKQQKQFKIGTAETNQKVIVQQFSESQMINRAQEIYVVRDKLNHQTRKKPPSRFIKIPVISNNVKIIQIQSSNRKRRRAHEIEENIYNQKVYCENCKYCQMARERKEIMKQKRQLLEKYSIETHFNSQSLIISSDHTLDRKTEHRQQRVSNQRTSTFRTQ